MTDKPGVVVGRPGEFAVAGGFSLLSCAVLPGHGPKDRSLLLYGSVKRVYKRTSACSMCGKALAVMMLVVKAYKDLSLSLSGQNGISLFPLWFINFLGAISCSSRKRVMVGWAYGYAMDQRDHVGTKSGPSWHQVGRCRMARQVWIH